MLFLLTWHEANGVGPVPFLGMTRKLLLSP